MRIIRACRELGIATVAVYSEADRAALHVRLADEALPIGPAPSRESYLRIDRVLDAARRSGRRRDPPRLRLPRRERRLRAGLRGGGLVFIGPRSRDDRADGREDRGPPRGRGGRRAGGARHARAAGRRRRARSARPSAIGFPVMLKAAAGGGGKGMRLVASAGRAGRGARPRAARRRRSAFGDDRVYLEKAIRAPAPRRDPGPGRPPRQRGPPRRARVLDPAPPPEGDRGEPVAAADARAARRAWARSRWRWRAGVGYVNAGTVEFLLDADRRALLPRDEHAAAGRAPGHRAGDGRRPGQLPDPRSPRASRCPAARRTSPSAATPSSAASTPRTPTPASCRAPGSILALRTPAGPGIRDDSGVYEGCEVPIDYDPLLSKLVAWGETAPGGDRAPAPRPRASTAVLGIRTTLPFFDARAAPPRLPARRLRHLLRADRARRRARRRRLPMDVAIAAAAIRALRETQAPRAARRCGQRRRARRGGRRRDARACRGSGA